MNSRPEGVVLNNNGLFVNTWNSDSKDFEITPLDGGEYWSVANMPLTIEGEPTFGDLFNAIGKFDIEILLALGLRARCDIVAFLEESVKEHTHKPDSCQIAFLRVKRHMTFRREGETTELETHLDFGAEGTITSSEFPTPEWTNISVSFVPINELVTYPFRLLTDVPVYIERHSPYRNKELLHSTTSFTLDEVVHAVLWEISFYGGPEKRDEFKDELDDRVAEVESKGFVGIPMEDVFAKLGWERPIDKSYCVNCLADIGTPSPMCPNGCVVAKEELDS
jgi:hypothetical protein